MDSCEATRIVFSRIQSLDSENASKIMGLLLIQDHGEREMIRLAFGPEALVHSVILKARKDLGLHSNSPSTPSTPSSPSPFLPSNPINISRQNSSSRLGINLPPSLTIPSSSSSSSATWNAFSEMQNPEDLISPSTLQAGASCSPMDSSSLPFFGGCGTDMIDEFQLQDQLSFLNDGSPTIDIKNRDVFYPQSLSSSPTGGVGSEAMLYASHGAGSGWGGSSIHRRSFSVNDSCLGSEDPNSGLGWKPCLYYARGFCKNGSSCRFLHGGLGESGAASLVSSDMAAIVGSPNKMEIMEQCHEILRSKSSAQQQRLSAASQLMGSANSIPYSPKCLNYLLQQPQNDSQRVAAALMMSEDMQKFGRNRLERNEFLMNGGLGIVNPASRQIYLTFPADSTFREEDVSNYFSIYGPVQDVRIPYQQKRMFGFVTFVYPETVKLILAKGNPHFVCDARVLVKPYKEKGKVPDKYRKQPQQMERGEFSPTGLDSRDPYDFQLGARMFYNTQEMLWRKKMEEQADLQQALELQTRRLLNLQLLDVKKHHHHHQALSTGSPIPSPTQSPSPFSQNLLFPPILSTSPDPVTLENGPAVSVPVPVPAVSVGVPGDKIVKNVASANEFNSNHVSGHRKDLTQVEESYILESLEHNLPDSPFASPTKAGGYISSFSAPASEAIVSSDVAANNNNLPTSSDMASFKSYNCQIPRFSSAVGMCAGSGGPTCPVGI